MRRTVTIALLAAAMTACGGGEEAASTTTTEVTVEATTTSTTMAATTTTEVVPFDVEVKRAAVALIELRNAVHQNPDVSRVSEYISDSCVCLEHERGIVEGFVRDGVRWNEPAIEVRGINLTDQTPDNPVVTLVARQPDAAIVRSDGTVRTAVPADETLPYRLSLLRDAGGEWRVNSLEVVYLNEDTTNRVLAEGTP